jgi:tetratricopeptide (TPR) repeat protein
VQLKGATIGVVGGFAAFPRRLAAREVARLGARLRRGVTRQTRLLVFGHGALASSTDAAIEAHFDKASAARLPILSENAFRRLIGAAEEITDSADMSVEAFAAQTRLEPRVIALLSLFDCFEHAAAPYSFRDVILGRKYRQLLEDGTSWGNLARSVHRSGKVTALTAVSLQASGPRVMAREGDIDVDADTFFEHAESAEHEGDYTLAAALYRKCLAADPSDTVSAYNLGNCEKEAGNFAEARLAYIRAIKLDANFVEAWFNFGTLLSEAGETEAARKHLLRAVAIDPTWSDPVYNLAALEYDAGQLDAARRWWVRYVELDPDSEWGKRAQRGIAYANMALDAQDKAS